MTRFLKGLKPYIKVAPFILLLISAVTCILAQTESYENLYKLIIQITGYSIFTNLIWFYYALVHKYCFYSKASIICLMCLNVFNLMYTFIDISYYYNYVNIILGFGVAISTVFLIKNK